MSDNQALDVEQLASVKTRGRDKRNRFQPELGLGTVTGEMNMRGLETISRVEEKAVRTDAQNRRHHVKMV